MCHLTVLERFMDNAVDAIGARPEHAWPYDDNLLPDPDHQVGVPPHQREQEVKVLDHDSPFPF